MPRRREALEAEHVRADDPDVLLGNGSKFSPQRVESVSIETPGACFEPAWIDQMRRAYLGDVDLQLGMLTDEHPGRTGVVEMDVGEQKVAQVLELQPTLTQRGVQVLEA